jgi:Ca2+-binding EF-hand superfamily protein
MSSISSIGGNASMAMQAMRGMQRPDPTQMAENLFSKLDTSGQGFIQKSDLQAAFDKISSAASNADDLFTQLDTDSDGKVTKQEFSDTLKQLSEQLDNHFMSMRMSDGMQGAGGMPPPPPPQAGEEDAGFSKEELTSQLEEIGSSDSKRASLISNIVNNFEAADADGDGKVSFKEAMAFDQANASDSASSASASTSATAEGQDSQWVMQIMRLMHAYGIGGESGSAAAATLSVSA